MPSKGSGKGKAIKNKRTHRILNGEIRTHGRVIRGVVKKKKAKLSISKKMVLGDLPGHKSDFFLDILMLHNSKKIVKADKFGRDYRMRLDAHDELLSTSAVRELMMGVLEEHTKQPLSSDEIKHINEVFNNISRVRIPTKYSGYALAGDVMQHPTAAGEGVFADSSKTMSRHNELDRQRKERVSDAMRDELKSNDATFLSVAHAGLREAIAFTLNEFTAPLTALDVKPHAIKNNASQFVEDAQLQSREAAKAMFVKLGGTQEKDGGQSAANRRGRQWGGRRGQGLRSVSPPRF